jgi:hypothetical protein
MGDVLPFRVERRGGYNAEDVERVLTEIRDQVSALEVERSRSEQERERVERERAAAEKTIDRLNRELREARSAAERARAKPSFSDLGSAFEQTLRLAEEQAAKMVREAAAETKALRDGVRGETEELRQTTTQAAEARVKDAEQRAAELLSGAERRAAEIENRAEAQLLDARTTVESAGIQAAGIRSEAERYAADMRAKIHEEVEDAKSEVALLRQLSERDQLRIKSEIKVMQDEAERERMNLHNQSTLVVQQRTEQADRLLADVQQRAVGLNAEAEQNLSRARTEAARLLGNARAYATEMITQARDRAEHLATRTNEHASRMLADAELRLSAIEDQRYAIEEFAFELRSLTSADQPVFVGDPEAQLDRLSAPDEEPVAPAALSLVRDAPDETTETAVISAQDDGSSADTTDTFASVLADADAQDAAEFEDDDRQA